MLDVLYERIIIIIILNPYNKQKAMISAMETFTIYFRRQTLNSS